MSDLKELLKSVSLGQVQEVVVGDDIIAEESGDKIDWSKIFFEPEAGNTYIIKFLPNLDEHETANIIHRTVYKLPDPTRKGKKFNYTATGKKDDPVLNLFFELNDKKKSGDVIAEKKIETYLQNKRQACVKIQILSSPKKEENGQFRLLRFHTFGDNAVIANKINEKLNPDPAILASDPEAKENIFNIFESSVLNLVCKESVFDGQKGRSFANSSWASKKRGALVMLEDGRTHTFSLEDIDDKGNIKPDVEVFFEALIKEITNPDISIYNWFSHKSKGDPRNTPEIEKYIVENDKKLNEIIPIIRDKTLQEIANYGTDAPSNDGSDDEQDEKSNKPKNILSESVPDELKGIVGNEGTDEKPATKSNTEIDEVDALLND